MVLDHEGVSKDRLLSYVRFYKDNSINLENKLFHAEDTIKLLRTELSAALTERENLLKQLEENKFSQTVKNNIIKGEVVQKDYRSIAFFDYDIIFNRRKFVIIKGSFFIKNTGMNPLEDPSVCFRIKPSSVANLKEGSIQLKYNQNKSVHQWNYMEGKWASKAKEKGEVWIRPNRHLKIKPQDTVSINNFQFTLNEDQYAYFTVDAFIYYKKENYKIRALNRIKCLF